MLAQSTTGCTGIKGLAVWACLQPKCFHASEVFFFGISTVGATAGDEDAAIIIIISIKTRGQI